jgi:hypothetical protein
MDKEAKKLYDRRYYLLNKEKRKAQQKEWAQNNPSSINASSNKWRKSNPQKNKQREKKWREANGHKIYSASIKRKYGLSCQEYNLMSNKQDGLCLICLNGPKGMLCVDHDHKTGKVRGLLCRSCNLMLGYAKDDAFRLSRAVDYLNGRLSSTRSA